MEAGDSAWNAGASAYYVEPHLRMALALAEATRDTAVLTDLANFFLAFTANLRPLQSVLARQSGNRGPASAPMAGVATDRVIPWLDQRATPPRPTECPLCSAQVFHPATRLMRLIAALPASDRSPQMLQFVQVYLPLLLNEHLLRLGYNHDPNGSSGLVQGWEHGSGNTRLRIVDTDLWLIASAAELLGAARLDPALVPLGSAEPLLRRMVDSGWRLLIRWTTPHPETRDQSGRTVGSLDLFEGDFDAFDDNRLSGYTDSVLPEGRPPRPSVNASWDISHIQRLPVFLRSMWDNRAALGTAGPDSAFLKQTVNQYLYVAFNGRWEAPQFHNFFDGSDGWYRVGYGGRKGWGYPPSLYCDNRDRNRTCLGRWAPAGWGLLAFVNPDLARTGQAILGIAADSTGEGMSLRERVYALGSDQFTWKGIPGTTTSPVLAEIVAEYLSGVKVAGGGGEFCRK